MAELSDIATLTVISSDRANLWQDRLVQRYSSVANRTTEHPTPAEGDLSYLEDSNTVWVYNGSAWVNIATPVTTAALADGAITAVKLAGDVRSAFEVDGSVEVATVGTTATMATAATLNLTIPAGWGSWACVAVASWYHFHSTTHVDHEAQMRIDGTDQQLMQAFSPASALITNLGHGGIGTLVARRSGMTTTGSRAILLRGRHTSTGGQMSDIALYARAVRLS